SLADAYPQAIIQRLTSRNKEFYIAPPLGYYARSRAFANEESPAMPGDVFVFVPDDLASEMRDSFADAFAQDQYVAKAIEAFPTFQHKFAQLRRAGARPVIASDSGSLGQFHHDAVWREMAAWRDLGVEPGLIIAAATTTPAAMLGDDRAGKIATGAYGDLVLYSGDLATGDFDRAHVSAVIKGGVIYMQDSAWTGPDTESVRAAIERFKASEAD
ncbi:MAG: amidohydrolase family protein, partial [Hyphococcus sp.]